MKRLFALVLVGGGLCVVNLAGAQEQPGLGQLGGQPPAIAQPLLPVIEAKKQVVVTWTLGEQHWDFSEVQNTYDPVSGSLDLNRGEATWTFEQARNMLEGEVVVHTQTEGSPFKAILLDADKVALGADMHIQFTKITGKKGDKLKAIFVLPPPEVLKLTKYIRIERRTKVGFESPQILMP